MSEISGRERRFKWSESEMRKLHTEIRREQAEKRLSTISNPLKREGEGVNVEEARYWLASTARQLDASAESGETPLVMAGRPMEAGEIKAWATATAEAIRVILREAGLSDDCQWGESMKKRGEPAERKPRKRGTIANYINEVCDYEAGYERYGSGEYSYPPIVPKLLLSILICLKPLVFILNALAGVGFCLLLKLLF